MWEFDWGSVEAGLDFETPTLPTSRFLVAPTFWEEHCTECAVPECFSTCELYSPRRDGGCHRFTGGLRRVPGVGGVFGDGARIRFERWGKLQTLLPKAVCSKAAYRILRLLDRMARCLDQRLGKRWTRSRLSSAWKWRRAELLAAFGSRPVDWSRCHLITAIKNPGDRIGLSVELVNNQIGIARARISIPAGTSYHRLSARELGLGNPLAGDHLRITPDGDISCDLEFLHLEIIQDIEDPEPLEAASSSSEPAHGLNHVPTNASEAASSLDSRNPSSAGEPGVLDPEHIDFLVSCEIELQLKTELSETHVARMAELLARSENLNLSGDRHDRESIMTKRTPSSIWVAGSCRDRFGDYGLVLAAQIDVRESSVHIMDLAMSCRVAEKAVEYAFLEWVRTVPSTLDGPLITANFVPSVRNQPLERSLRRCGFVNDDAGLGMWIDGSHPVAGSSIVKAVSCES